MIATPPASFASRSCSFPCVVRGRVLNRRADLRDPALNLRLLAGTVDNRGVVLGDGDLPRLAEHVEADVLELHAEFLRDDLAAGQDGDVLQHRLAAVAEARRLDGGDLEPAAKLVHHQGCEGFALDIFGDDEERLPRLDHQLEQRHHRLQRAELLLVDQDDRVLELGDHLVGVGDEVRAEIAAIELHAIDHFGLGHEPLVLLDGDDALVADLLHRFGDLRADLGLAVRSDRADLANLLRA